MDNPRPQLAATVAACDTAAVSHAAKLASIPGMGAADCFFLVYGGPLKGTFNAPRGGAYPIVQGGRAWRDYNIHIYTCITEIQFSICIVQVPRKKCVLGCEKILPALA